MKSCLLFLSGSFSNLRKFLHTQVLNMLSRTREVPSVLALSSSFLLDSCPVNPSHLGFPSLLILPSQCQDFSGLAFLSTEVWKLTLGNKRGQQLGLISLVSSLRNHCPTLLWPKSENHCFLCFPQFISCFGNKEGKNRNPLLQLGLKQKVLLIYDDAKLSKML